jgi:hypothetical protein
VLTTAAAPHHQVSSNPTQHRVRARHDRAIGLAVASVLDHRSAGMRVGLDYFVYESQHERELELKKRAEEERERWRVCCSARLR